MILIWIPLKNEIWKGLNRFFPKDARQKSEGGQWGPIKKNSTRSPWKRRKNHLINNFLRNGRVKIKFSKFFEDFFTMRPLNRDRFYLWSNLISDQTYI